MAWKTKRLWTLFMAFVFLEHASGGGVWRNTAGHQQPRDSLDQLKKPSQSQLPDLSSYVSSSVAVSGTGFEDYYPFGPQAGSLASQSPLLDSSSSSVANVQQGYLQQGFSGSYSSVPSDVSGQTVPASKQVSSWTQLSGKWRDPSYPVPLPPQPQTFPAHLESLGGDHTSSSSKGMYDLHTGPSLYAAKAVSQGPLQKLTSRLFTSQGDSVVSSRPKVASDLPQKGGTPPLTVPSHSVGTWQPSSSLKPGFPVGHGTPGVRLDQYRPVKLVSSWPKVASDLPQQGGTPSLTVPSHSVGTWQPSSSLKPGFPVGHGAPGARLDKYSKADWTSATYDLSQDLSSGFAVQKQAPQQKPGLPFTASVFTQSQQPATQTSSDWSSAAVSPSLTFSQDFSEWSLKPVEQRVSSQYDYSVKH